MTATPDRRRHDGTPRVERADPNDLMQLAFDVGPVPMQMGAVVLIDPLIDPLSDVDATAALAVVGQRLSGITRLRQRLVRAPVGCGRPYWLDDPTFDLSAHLRVAACPPPMDESALLDLALAIVTTPLPPSRPLWSATLVTGLEHGRTGLVLVLHHVVADGLGGLAVLGELVDRTSLQREPRPATTAPRPAPSRTTLARDAWRERARRLLLVPSAARRLPAARAELGTATRALAPRTSLNRPTGTERRAGVVRVDLGALRSAAHAHAGTVNDVILTAVTGALGQVLAARGERVPHLVVSVPVSSRTETDRRDTGNHVGVTTVAAPLGGTPTARLEAVATTTGRRDRSRPGTSAALLQPFFRVLAHLGVLRWFMNHQRLVNTFVTNMPGPPGQVTFMGAPVTSIIPLSGTTGNAGVAFAALSYAGTLTLTAMADPDALPELDELIELVKSELDALVSPASPS